MSIQVGSVVTLKSGGPKMTAGEQLHGDYYRRRFYWFSGENMQEYVLEDSCVSEVPGTEESEK